MDKYQCNIKILLLSFSSSFDATYPKNRLGRFVNDSPKPNSAMKLISFNNEKRLCLFALKDILPNQEIVYDYGASGLWWRKFVSVQYIRQITFKKEIYTAVFVFPIGVKHTQ